MREKSCSILIPTYNGADILDECLPSVVEQVDSRGNTDEILVIDNASSDGTKQLLDEKFPSVSTLRLEENKAIFALNDGAEAARHPYLFFLNNDMILKPGCIDELLAPFDASDVFAVTGKVYQWDRSTVQAGRRRPAFGKGWFWYLPAGNDDAGVTIHALGGQSIFHREKFLRLGGIDPLFSPFYHEDLDISWRAYRNGWRIHYNPAAEMIHRGAATAGRLFTPAQIKTIMQKNLFLFIWKNIHDPLLTASHIAWLLPRLLREAAGGNLIFAAGLAGALKQFSQATAAREAARQSPLSDADVLSLFDR